MLDTHATTTAVVFTGHTGPDPAERTPGSAGAPDGVPGQVLCGTWLPDLTAGVAGWWPLLATVVATVSLTPWPGHRPVAMVSPPDSGVLRCRLASRVAGIDTTLTPTTWLLARQRHSLLDRQS